MSLRFFVDAVVGPSHNCRMFWMRNSVSFFTSPTISLVLEFDAFCLKLMFGLWLGGPLCWLKMLLELLRLNKQKQN